MITSKDIVEVDLTTEDLAYCREHPVEGCARKSTGQLKALGNLALQRVLGVDDAAFREQSEAAESMCASYVCEVRNNEIAGITPTVSVIKNDEITNKRLIVPANQLYKHPQLHKHYTVGVFIQGKTNKDGELTEIERTFVAGFIPTMKLRRWLKKGGTPPFTVQSGSVAITPAVNLVPMSKLLSEVRWQRYCV